MYLQMCAALSLADLSALLLVHGAPSLYKIVFYYLALFSVQYALVNLYYILIYPFYVSSLRFISGPKDHHFFIGQTLNQFRANGPYELYLSWSRQWPKAPFIRYLSFANTETLLVNSLRAHQEVLSTKCYSFVKPPFFARIVGEVTGMGLVFAEGEEHKKQRKMLNGTLSESFWSRHSSLRHLFHAQHEETAAGRTEARQGPHQDDRRAHRCRKVRRIGRYELRFKERTLLLTVTSRLAVLESHP